MPSNAFIANARGKLSAVLRDAVIEQAPKRLRPI